MRPLNLISYGILTLLFFSCDQLPPPPKAINDQQKVELDAGWNPISFYIIPARNNDSLPFVEKFLDKDLIRIEGAIGKKAGVFDPIKKINSLTKLKLNHAYLLKVKSPIQFVLQGEGVWTDSIYLDSQERNASGDLVSYFTIPGDQNIFVEDLLFEDPSQITLIHELRGGTYWPDYQINDLQILKPGKAYLFVFKSPIWMKAKANAVSKEWKPDEINPRTPGLPTTWVINNHNPFVYFLLFPNHFFPALQDGDYLSAKTTSGYCAGLSYMRKEADYTLMILYANDLTTKVIDGFHNGEDVMIQYFHAGDQSIQSYRAFQESFPNTIDFFQEWNVELVNRLQRVE